MISKKSEKITILGSKRQSNIVNPTFTFKYDIPFDINISGQKAVEIQAGTKVIKGHLVNSVELLSSEGNIVAFTNIAFTDFDFQSDKNFVISKTSDNTLLLQWHFKNDENIEAIAEYILVDTGFNEENIAKADIFGWRTTPNEYTNTFFDSESSGAGCVVALNNNASINLNNIPEGTVEGNNFSDWKTAESATYDKFYLACTSVKATNPDEYKLQTVELKLPNVNNFLPEISTFSSPTENYTLNDSEALSLSTAYNVQVQHTGISAEKTAATSWSKPIAFTTRSADTTYQVTVPTDLVFTAEQARDLTFKIANTGSEDGAPKAIIRLPFEALKAVNGKVNDFFNVSVGGQNCAMAQKDGKTDFTCQLSTLKANDTADLKAKITVKDTAIKSIEYKVCDTEKCDATDFTAVNITVKTASSAPAETKSSSSSSGGSMFWLFLMAPLLLVRRK